MIPTWLRTGTVVLAGLLLSAVPTAAHAGIDNGGDKGGTEGGDPPAGADGQDLFTSIHHSRIQISGSGSKGGSGKGSLTPIDPNWTPPPCWYEPTFKPEQLRDFVKKLGDHGLAPVAVGNQWQGPLWEDHYKLGKRWTYDDPGYKDFNVGKKGMFWRAIERPDSRGNITKWDCFRTAFWVPQGETPKRENAITPKGLAEYAYDRVRVPDTEVELKPKAKSTVNLPTWAWLDKGTFKDVHVRASLPDVGMWSEVTAKPVSLHLNPGTGDAKTYPASGECRINDDGSIGTPYRAGDSEQDPPCGIQYLRATDGAPYKMKASLTWKITWEGSDHDGVHKMPDGVFETTQAVDVQEVQSVNR
ncbi:hypothetical protein [Streptomyces sp. NPDC059009]|uniref:hypothetical protein n=1 Tax=Streptomyces sp. NPDC059009 TaxID=3346694 RepID=UPI00367B0584